MAHPLFQLVDSLISSTTGRTIAKIIIAIGIKFVGYTILKILYKCLKPCLPWTDQPDSTVPLLPQASNLQFIRGDSAGGMSAAACGLRPMNLSSTAASNFDTKLKPVYTDNAININSNQENNGSQLRMSDESLERASNILLASINARRSRRAVVMDPSPST